MKRTTMVVTAFLVAWMIALPMGWAQTDKDHSGTREGAQRRQVSPRERTERQRA
jgi:hypothetical protein